MGALQKIMRQFGNGHRFGRYAGCSRGFLPRLHLRGKKPRLRVAQTMTIPASFSLAERLNGVTRMPKSLLFFVRMGRFARQVRQPPSNNKLIRGNA